MHYKLPKKTIVSTGGRPNTTCHPSKQWSRRNDSSNICSLLSPDDQIDRDYHSSDDEEPRRPLILSKTKRPHAFKSKGCSSCYCNDRPVTPLLPCDCRPDQCMCKDEAPPPMMGNGSEVHSVFLKYSPESRRRIAHEKYTRRRKNYENATSNYFVDLKTQLGKLEDELCEEDVSEAPDHQENCVDDQWRIIQELRDFRKKYFFSCQSSGVDLQRKPLDHECQHDFTLNERLQPVPKNPDVNGLSRCTTCNKTPSSLQQSTSALSAQVSSSSLTGPTCGSSRTSHASRRKCSSASSYSSSNSKKNNICPQRENADASTLQRFSFNVGREVFNIDVPDIFGDEINVKAKRKGAAPVNSVALRFQKGVY